MGVKAVGDIKLNLTTMKANEHSENQSNDSDELYRERFPNILGSLTESLNKTCSVKGLKRRFPIAEWLPKYKTSFLLQDIVAGISVGLTTIPQSIAYAVVAGLPPQYGLYSSFMGCFVYMFFGSCKDVTIGPTAIMSLMIHSAVVNLNVNFAILGTFLSGCVIFLFGILHLGFLIQFISAPTITAFITAATITIGSGQVKPLIGIKSGNSSEFIDSWINVFEHLNEIKVSDTLLGIMTIILLALLKKCNQIKKWPVFFKYLSIARNAIAVVSGIIIAYIFHINGSDPFRLTGEITPGLPAIKLPPFETEFNGEHYNFLAMARALGLSLITIPLVSILESIAIAKAFSKGKIIDATQEMIALGLCNMVSSFAQSIPITGSFTRTAVNNMSGVRTTFGGVFTGILILLALGFLTGTFYFIPKTTLAAVIISAMLSMFEFKQIVEIYRTKRSDFIPFLMTFLVSLFLGLEFGIICGVAINALFTLHDTSRPIIHYTIEKTDDIEILVVTPNQSLIYSSAEYFESSVMKKVLEYNAASLIVIDGQNVNAIDTTVVKNITSIINDMKLNNKGIIFWNWKQEPFNLVMRYNKQYLKYFKSAEAIRDLLMHIKTDDNLSETTE